MSKKTTFLQLLRLMARLRGRGGCPWDREQTHRSLVKYLKEESGELVRAIRRGQSAPLCEELGDVLHQVLFHAQIAAERGRFTMADVVDGLAKKLVRRHPHVFGTLKLKTARQVEERWGEIKKREKELRWAERKPSAARRR